jgi:hypothetical protein
MRHSSIIACGQANIEAHHPKNNPGENRGCMKKPKLTTMRFSKLFSDFLIDYPPYGAGNNHGLFFCC